MEPRTRSPRYPQFDLAQAIEKTKKIYKEEHTHRADKEVIAKDLGYNGLNGASLGAIASLRQYNLLESVGDGLKVTEDATTLIELPVGHPDRGEILWRVALAPAMFSELYGHFGDRLPSDENIRLYLVKRGFNKNAANTVIRTFRDTISLVKEQAQEYNSEPSEMIRSQDMSLIPNAGVSKINPAWSSMINVPVLQQDDSITEELHYRVSDECKVRVLFEGNVTREAITKLIAYLELGKDDFPFKSVALEKKVEE